MRILIIDDDDDHVITYKKRLMGKGYETDGSTSISATYDLLTEKGPMIDIALIDMDMENDSEAGLKLIATMREQYPWIVPIVLTGHPDFGVAGACMKAGAFSYIVKAEYPSDVQLKIIARAADARKLTLVMPHVAMGMETLGESLRAFSRDLHDFEEKLQRLSDEICQIRSTTDQSTQKSGSCSLRDGQ